MITNTTKHLTTRCFHIMHIHTLTLQASAIRTHLYAIAFTHKLHDHTETCISTRIRLPITLYILKKVINNMSELYQSRYQRRLDTALSIPMYQTWLRVHEVAIAKHNRHTLEFADVKCRNKYAVINSRTFKHSKGQAASLKIAATHEVCWLVSEGRYRASFLYMKMANHWLVPR